MNTSLPPRALIIEPDPSLSELFPYLLEGWDLRVVNHLNEISREHFPADLLIIDEDCLPRGNACPPHLFHASHGNLPTIILGRQSQLPGEQHPLLVLPKPFPVALFKMFVVAIQELKANPPDELEGC